MTTKDNIVSDEWEIPLPSVFTDFGGCNVRVNGETSSEEQHYACPRCGNDAHTHEVDTSRRVWLYCYWCGIFYPEFGMWGYKR